MSIEIKAERRAWSCSEATAWLGNYCWWKFTKSFQSARFLSDFLVSEKWGGGRGWTGGKEKKKPFLLPGYSRSLYIVFQLLKRDASFFIPFLGWCFFQQRSVCVLYTVCNNNNNNSKCSQFSRGYYMLRMVHFTYSFLSVWILLAASTMKLYSNRVKQ